MRFVLLKEITINDIHIMKNDIEKMIDEHARKYAWIKGPVEFEDTCFTKEDYLNRLNNLLDTDIDAKIENINNTRKNNDIEYKKY